MFQSAEVCGSVWPPSIVALASEPPISSVLVQVCKGPILWLQKCLLCSGFYLRISALKCLAIWRLNVTNLGENHIYITSFHS